MPASPVMLGAQQIQQLPPGLGLRDDAVLELGRSKLATKWRASSSRSRCAISVWVAWVAVAVNAMRGTAATARGAPKAR